jgi:hypothetical protein
MRILLFAAALAAASLAACQAAQFSPESGPTRHVLRYNGIAGTDISLPVYLPEGNPITPSGAAASDSYPGLGAKRAIDGHDATAWVSADPESAESWITVHFDKPYDFRGIRIKTGPTPEATTFKVRASDDGKSWSPVSGRLVNLTWGFEPQEVGGSGRYLQVRFFNSMQGAHNRFSLYELKVYGQPRR